MTKTPEITWHHEDCHYRLFFEAGAFVLKYRELLSTHEELLDAYEWTNKGNKEFHDLLADAEAAVKQANLERDGYKYRLETLQENEE